MDYITIHDIGVNQAHYSDFQIKRPNGLQHWLLLLVKSRACFIIENKKIITEPNTAIIFAPGMEQNYSAILGSENYCDYWMEFSINKSHLTERNIPIGRPFRGFDSKKVETLFTLLLDEHFFGQKKKEMYIELFTVALLEKIGDAVYRSPEKVNELEIIRDKVFKHPEYEWNSEKIALELGYSSGHFKKLYRDHYGVSLKSDIIRQRIEKASSLLLTTNYSIRTVSELCGYQSDKYFIRQFKNVQGITPLQYRNKLGTKPLV